MIKISRNSALAFSVFVSAQLLASQSFAAGQGVISNTSKTITNAIAKGEKATSDILGDKTDVDFYGSIRIGVDYIDAGVDQDGANGRDFLSRIGVKAKYSIDDSFDFIGQIEYGTRSDVVDFAQNGGLALRQLNVGIKHKKYGSLKYGSQTTTFHKFVRGAYFNDGLDTLRLATIREDDYLAYDIKKGPIKFGAGIQLEGQDGDDIDQYQVGAEYSLGTFKLQGAYVRDNEGDSRGNLYGVRGWWTPNKNFKLSAYRHQQDDGFDFPSGVGATGTLRLRARDGGLGNINFVTTCVGQDRATTGIYGSGRFNKHQLHARYAIDECDTSGDVSSIKAEYVYHFDKSLRAWVAYEHLETDSGRTPALLASSGDAFDSVQLGVRFDF